ncbi:MAG: aminotransferase class IV, partial [Verrucomicrobiota bacterium]|nr:aminotransferase class IV [Verrucomicrobiota bacterium]
SFDEWTAHCRELIARNKVSDGILRLHITRGTGKRGYSSMGSSTPTVVISLHDAPPVANPKTCVNIITATGILSDHDPLSTFKTANKLVNIIAMREAERAEAHDAVLLNGQGYTTETSSSNIFIILEGKLWTPPLASGCLSGITRGYVLELAAELGINSLQKNLELEQLEHSEGFFLTNSTQGIQSVKSLNGVPIARSLMTSELQKVYREKITAATK